MTKLSRKQKIDQALNQVFKRYGKTLELLANKETHMDKCAYHRLYKEYKAKFETVWEWYLQTRETYDGMLKRKDIETEETERLKKAVKNILE